MTTILATVAAVAAGTVCLAVTMHAWYRSCARRYIRDVKFARSASDLRERLDWCDAALEERSLIPRRLWRFYGVEP